MQPFRKFLCENIVLLDGAMGTELVNLGLQKGECPEIFNFEKPELVKKVQINLETLNLNKQLQKFLKKL